MEGPCRDTWPDSVGYRHPLQPCSASGSHAGDRGTSRPSSLHSILIRKLGFQGSEARLRHMSIPNADLVYLEVRCEHAVVLCSESS